MIEDLFKDDLFKIESKERFIKIDKYKGYMEMNLYRKDIFDLYESNSQRIRVLTEKWTENNMFCPACLNLHIKQFPNNMPVADFFCPKCNEQYQLKSQKNKFGKEYWTALTNL